MILEFPKPSKVAAAVSLLGDEGSEVVRACRSQLVEWGEVVRQAVRQATHSTCARRRVAARCVLRSLDLRVWTMRVQALGERVSDGSDSILEEGLELFLRLGCPHATEVAEMRAKVGALIEGASRAVRGRTTATVARELAEFLGEKQDFRGCPSSYYRPENLFLDRVLERRRGLPIALVALYLLVGRGVGLEVTAVQLPDSYFLARVHGRRPILLDPFHGGRSVTKVDCRRYLRSVGTSNGASAWLRDMDDIDVLLVMMSTLGRVHEHREDREFHEALLQAQRSLSPG